MGVKHFEVVKQKSHADKQWSPERKNGAKTSSDGRCGVATTSLSFKGSRETSQELKALYWKTSWRLVKGQRDGKIHFKIRQLLLNVTHFRDMLKEFRILEGFKLWRVKNEKSRMIVECKSDDYIWRICAPKITTITIKKTHLKEI